jgi:hypothetical protein
MTRPAFALILLLAGCGRTDLYELGGAEMQKRHLTIPLAGGIATGDDGKQLQIGKSEELQNVRPGRRGEVIQRAGTRALGTSLIGSAGTLPASWALGTLRGDLVSFSGVGDHPANAYSPTANAWSTDASTGAAPIKTKRRGPIVATLQQISGNGLLPDVFYSAGYYWVIYKTTRNGVENMVLTVIDAATGAPVGEQAYAAGPYISWGVRVVNGSAVFVYATAALISIDTWPTSNPALGPTTRVSVAKAVANSGRQFDMMVKDSTTISAAYHDGAAIQCFDYAPTAGAATFWTPKDAAAANIAVDQGIAWMQDLGGSGKIALTATLAGVVRTHWDIPTAGATRQAATSYTMDPASSARTVASFTMTSAATGQFTVLYDNGAITPSSVIKAATREAGVIARATYYGAVAIGSKPFQASDGKYYMAAEYISATQPTRFIVRVPETITSFANLVGVVAKTQVNNGYVGSASVGPLCPVSNPAANEYVFGNAVQLRLPGNPTAYVPQGVGIDLVHVKFKPPGDTTIGSPREAIDSLFTPGGTVGQFDGRSYVDAGFAYYPEQILVNIPAGGGAMTPGVTYYYVQVFSWVDFNGRTWYSAPSRVTAIAMGANTKQTLTIPTYQLADRDDIQIQVYRGAANDNVTFGLIGSVANDPTVGGVTFVDVFADSAVASGQALYTNGAAGNRPLPADGIPGFSSIAIAGGRAWGISNDNPYEIWPSNKFIPGQGWRFSEQNKIILNDSLGPAYAVAALPNGVVTVFKENAYYFISGDGPNQAGNGGSFTVSTPAVGVGTTNPRSILETPSGIELRSSGTTRAWYRVNTALQAEYIGSPIERYSNQSGVSVPLPIIGAVFVPATGETRYYTDRNDPAAVLVHDPISDTWMIDVNADVFYNALCVCPYGTGAAVYGVGRGVVIDDPSVASDLGTGYVVRTVTPWIKGADLDGYATFIRARGVGETFANAPVLAIALQADFDATANLTSQTASPGALWDWELKYTAKLSSFRLILSYTANTVPVKMSALVVEYGVKSGLAPLPYTKRGQ